MGFKLTFYHATFAERLPSILRQGLRADHDQARHFVDAEPGVYLSTDPVLAIGFLLEHLLETQPEQMSPRQAVEAFRVIVIDGSRVDTTRLSPDPQVGEGGDFTGMFWLYNGVIDVINMPILTVADLDSVL